jgi:hypothetical protein
MTHIVVKVMIEVLLILALVAKEIKQGKLSEFIKGLDRLPPSAYPVCGSPRVVPSSIGRSPVLCGGSTRNVRSPSLCSPILANELYYSQPALVKAFLRTSSSGSFVPNEYILIIDQV